MIQHSQATVQPPATVQHDGSSPAGSRSSRILVNAGFRAAADVGSKIATAALYVFVARRLGASQFGIYAFALSLVSLVTALGFFGQDIVLAREVSRDHGRLEEYYSNAMLARAMFSAPPLLLCAGVAALAGMSSHTLIVVLLLGVGLMGEYMVQVPYAVFQAYERVELVTIVLIVQRWVTTAIAISALYLGAGLVTVAGIYCIGTLMASALGTWMMFRQIARPRLRLDFHGALEVTRQAFPIGIALVALTVLFRVDMSMLAIFKPSSVVGQYGAAYKLLETTAFFSWAINVALLPSLARLSTTTTPTAGFVYQRGLKLLVAITLPFAVAVAVLAGPIISLIYGVQYHRAALALTLLAPTIALFPFSALTSQLFFTQGRRPTVAIVYALVGLENIGLNCVLIPRLSLSGAAAGTSISELLVAGSLVLVSGKLRGRLEIRRMLTGPVLASTSVGILLALLHGSPAVGVCLAIVAYFVVLLAHERIAFPDDFAVVHVLIGQLRARLAGPATSGTLQ